MGTMGNIHDGHRERMKQRFKEHGLDNFSDHNVLELLLFYVIPRKDVNPIAHALLDTFGSLYGVFEAPVDALAKVPGVGESAALLIKLVPQVNRRYLMSKATGDGVLNSSQKAGAYLIPKFLYEREEVVLLVCLDGNCRIISCREIGRGETNSTVVSVRRVVEVALSQNSTSVILAHNHTSGIALPSQEDLITTQQIARALHMVNIQLADHIVVANDDFVSMSDCGVLTLSQ